MRGAVLRGPVRAASGGGGGGPALVFRSTWSTAIGTSLSAVTDGGAWDSTYGNYGGEVLEVVSPASVSWTGAGNVLRVRQRGPTFSAKPRVVDVVPESTTHWGRFYFRNDETETQHLHPVCYPVGPEESGIGIVCVPWSRLGTASGMELVLPYGGAYPNNRWTIANGSGTKFLMTTGTWYRYEWQIEYLNANDLQLRPRVYDMSGTLLYDESAFYTTDFPFSTSLKSWHDAGNFVTLPSAAARRAMRIFSIGNEGPATTSDNNQSWYHADLAISTQGWVGA